MRRGHAGLLVAAALAMMPPEMRALRVPAARRQRQWTPAPSPEQRGEIAEWNAAVDRKKAERKRARRVKGNAR